MTEVTEEAEQDEKTDVTVGWVASWFMGVVFLLVTLSYLLTFDSAALGAKRFRCFRLSPL